MKGITHEIFTRADVDNSTTQTAHIIHRRLERTIVRSEDIRIADAHSDVNRRESVERILRVLTSGLIGVNGKDANEC